MHATELAPPPERGLPHDTKRRVDLALRSGATALQVHAELQHRDAATSTTITAKKLANRKKTLQRQVNQRSSHLATAVRAPVRLCLARTFALCNRNAQEVC